jgi:hypothetical protein
MHLAASHGSSPKDSPENAETLIPYGFVHLSFAEFSL